ncbi:MAG: hypothetical protein R3B49_05810 [Phycisphaerales bacterium]
MRSTKTLALAAALGSGLVLAACANPGPPPRGDSGGRIDPYRSTSVDAGSGAANTVDLLQFSDKVGQAIAMRIASVDEIAGSPEKVVIEMGDIENKTYTPTSDFEIMRRRVFTGLVNSSAVSRLADIVEAPEVMDAQRGRFANDPGQTDRYGTRQTYLLQGYFGELTRGGGAQSNYYYEMTLTNLQSRRIIFAEQFDSKQIR